MDSFGYAVAVVALPWTILDQGGSASVAGLAVAMELLPYAAVGLLAGLVGDRRLPRSVLGLAHAIQAGLAATLAVWLLLGEPPLAALLVIPLMIGAARIFADASALAAMTRSVPRSDFVASQATLGASWSLGALAGPLVAAGAIGLAGPSCAFFVEAGAYLGALGLVVCLPGADAPARPLGSVRVWQSLQEGLGFLLSERVVRKLVIVAAVRGALVSGLVAFSVPFLRVAGELDVTTIGVILSVAGGVGMIAPLPAGMLDRRFSAGRPVPWCVALCGVSALLVAPARPLLVLAVGLCGVQLGFQVSAALIIGERQRRAADHSQAFIGSAGRTLEKVAASGGVFIASGAIAAIGLRPTFALLGGVLVLSALVAAYALRGSDKTSFAKGGFR